MEITESDDAGVWKFPHFGDSRFPAASSKARYTPLRRASVVTVPKSGDASAQDPLVRKISASRRGPISTPTLRPVMMIPNAETSPAARRCLNSSMIGLEMIAGKGCLPRNSTSRPHAVPSQSQITRSKASDYDETAPYFPVPRFASPAGQDQHLGKHPIHIC